MDSGVGTVQADRAWSELIEVRCDRCGDLIDLFRSGSRDRAARSEDRREAKVVAMQGHRPACPCTPRVTPFG